MSVLSMTGFGEASLEISNVANVRVQCKSVNQRFLDLVLRVPSVISNLEPRLQKLAREKISRGRLELSITIDSYGVPGRTQINAELLNEMVLAVKNVNIGGVSSADVLKSFLPTLWSRREILDAAPLVVFSEANLQEIQNAVTVALDLLVESRLEEGKSLYLELCEQLSFLSNFVSQVEGHVGDVAQVLGDRLLARLSEWKEQLPVDEARIAQEIAILADKSDVREELVRLKTHIDTFNKSIKQGGRKLEFLLQEMLREVNTIGSKAQQVEVSTLVVEAKSSLEKMREQIQNVE